MAEKEAIPYDPIEARKLREWNMDYLTMPGNRDLSRPYYKDTIIPLRQPGGKVQMSDVWEEKRIIQKKESEKYAFIKENIELENQARAEIRTNFKIQMSRLTKHVEIGMKAAEQDLEIKKNKLKSLILSEEALYTKEYIHKAQNRAAEILEEKRVQVNNILKAQEKMKIEEAKAKIEELAKQNSQQLRIEKSIILRKEAAAVQKQQICEKYLKKEREAEEKKFWVNILDKIDDEKQKIDEEDNRVRLAKMKENGETLRKQVIGKELQREEIKLLIKREGDFMKKLAERIEEEKKIEEQSRLEKIKELKQAMDEQLKASRELKETRKQKEFEYDKFYAEQLKQMVMKEEMEVQDTRAQERMESELFRQQLKELKAARKEEEKLIEELRQKETEKKYAEVGKNKEIADCARQQLMKEVVETRAQQILEKQKLLQKEKEIEDAQNAWSRYIFDKNRELDLMKKTQTRKGAVRTVHSLDHQEAYKILQTERKNKENVELLKEIERQQQAADELAMRLKPSFGDLHPNTQFLLEHNKQ